MPIFCLGVNRAGDEKLVPITRHNGASIVPYAYAIVLDLVEMGPENGPFWELEAEQSQQAASENAPSPQDRYQRCEGDQKRTPLLQQERISVRRPEVYRRLEGSKFSSRSTDPLIVPHGGRTRIRVNIYHKPIDPLHKVI